MPRKSTNKKPIARTPYHRKKDIGFCQQLWVHFTHCFVQNHFWRRLLFGLMALLIAVTGSMYAIGQWYIYRNRNTPLTVGATFIPDYARYYDLEPHETLSAIINDLGVKRLRLVSYWENIE